jgi:uncharacterized protein
LIKAAVVLLALAAQDVPDQPEGFVTDLAGVLDASQKRSLEGFLSDFNVQTTNEIGVLIVDTTGGASISRFAVQVAERWSVGKRGIDNGVLFVVAIQDRKMSIQVGYGLEGDLTDLESSYIIQDVVPYFRGGRFYEGIVVAVKAIQNAIAADYVPQSGRLSGEPGSSPGISMCYVVFLIFFFFGPMLFLRRGFGFFPIFIGGGRWHSSGGGGFSGGGGGGFGGFGGGGFGGGGASGGW